MRKLIQIVISRVYEVRYLIISLRLIPNITEQTFICQKTMELLTWSQRILKEIPSYVLVPLTHSEYELF